MKKTIEVEAIFCDECGKQCDYPDTCLCCGVEHCYDCSKKLGITYAHGVFFSGGGDGYYCLKCDAKLPSTTPNSITKIHGAYRAIQAVRDGEEAHNERFKEKADRAEAHLQSLIK